MKILLIMILWTWGLTPLWVNIVGTVLATLQIFATFIVKYGEKLEENKIRK